MKQLPGAASCLFLLLAFAAGAFFLGAPARTRASAIPVGTAATCTESSRAELTESEIALLEQNPAMLQPGGDSSEDVGVVIVGVLLLVVVFALIVLLAVGPFLLL